MNETIAALSIMVIIGVLLFSMFVLFTEEEKPKPTIMYTEPIGPTQEPPYILPSKLIAGNDGQN